MAMNVYFISGMGADRRLFRHIQLPEGFDMHFLDWIKPLDDESIPAYAARLAEGIDTSRPFVLVGVSLGGIMSTEIAKLHPPAATFLLGSIPLAGHLPGYYHTLGRRLGLLKVLPGSFFKRAATVKRFVSGESAGDKRLIWQMIEESDDQFLIWAMKAVLKWENKDLPQPLYHIHGSRDIVFPIRLTRPSHTIRKGGHLIVMTHADQVNVILRDVLSKTRLAAHTS